NCPSPYQQKLMAMGFLPGATFKTIRHAPFGGPIQIEIKGTQLSLRRSELALIEVISI
ncbi:MAG: hypothetical protein EBX40_06435, partial [Gammaproteobacteria bacterium]|nr:hypothetical protein [Gammaproteobacteria bacterium]